MSRTTDAGPRDAATTTGLPGALARVADALERHAAADRHDTTPYPGTDWAAALDGPLPDEGWGADRVVDVLLADVVPHGIPADSGGFTGWIFAAPPTVPTVARTVMARVGSQRYLQFAPSLLEGTALRWLRELFGLPGSGDAVFASGGSAANLLGLGAARQRAYERAGIDPSRQGLAGGPVPRLYGSTESHHCLLKAAGALGIGRDNVVLAPVDARDRVDVAALAALVDADIAAGHLPVAVVGTAGTTNRGAIDPIAELVEVCRERDVWLHVDGAYGLPGVLDERIAHRFAGVAEADSVVTDLHKWLNVPTGIGATFVREPGLLGRAFTMEASDYIEGQFAEDVAARSGWDAMGPPYHYWSLELSAPASGMVVWATLAEIGAAGFAARVARHRDCARLVHELATAHPRLESLLDPELSVACLRYVGEGSGVADPDAVNAEILTRLREAGTHAPSGTFVDGAFVIRPCFLSAWSHEEHARGLVDAVVATGDGLTGAAAG